MVNGTSGVVELLAVVRLACEALMTITEGTPKGRLFFPSVGMTLNARLGRALREEQAAGAYVVIAKAADEARGALNQALARETSVRFALEEASAEAVGKVKEVAERLASLGATARVRALEAKVAANESGELVAVELKGSAKRLLQWAEELDGWVSGNKPVPSSGPSEPLSTAFRECAAAFRRAAMRAARVAHL